MRKGSKTATIGLLLALSLSAQTEPEEPQVDPEIVRLRALVEAGVLAPAELARQEQALAKARLQDLLRDLLQQPNLVPDQITTLLETATELRRIEREALKSQRDLITAGAAAANSLVAFRDRLDFVERQYELATTRASLARERAAIVSAEDRLDELIEEELAFWSEGGSTEWESDILQVDVLYFEEFGEGLPISAAGSTDLHVAMGFDHTARYDIALHPDEFEGLFLMSILEEWNIPYIAFRSAVPGQATGPHIHVGPPSLRLTPEEVEERLDQLLGDRPTPRN